MGHQVTIPSPQNIQKVAILTSPPNVITFILGVNDKMVATSNAIKNSTFLNHIYPGLKDIPAVRQSAGKVNIEALLQADPQICLGSDIDLQVVEKATSIPCLRCIDDAGSNDYPGEQKKEVRFFGKVFGKEAQAEKYCKYLDDNVAAVEKAVGSLSDSQKLKVYLGFNADHLTTFGAGSFMDAWITAGGCINAAHPVSSIGGSEGGLVAISMEQVLSWNPDILIIDTGTPEDVYKDTKWATVPAVKNKRVYVLPRGMFGWNRASTEPAALFPMWLGITAYPDKFPGKTVNDELKRFYSEIINYQLTDADISLILTGK
jgi:iron complex transport system substrate-binding protein